MGRLPGMYESPCGGKRASDPVTLPCTESAADANTFVCEFVGGSAANETGVGGGLYGADLILSQFNGVAGASGNGRQISANQGFNWTASALQAMLNGPEYSILWFIENVVYAGSAQYMAYMSGLSIMNLYMTSDGRFNPQAAGYPGGTTITNMSSSALVVDKTGPIWVALWRKLGHLHFGFVRGDINAPPTGWDSFPELQRMYAPGCGNYSTETWATIKCIVGYTSSPLTFKMNKLIVSKVGIAAAKFC